MDPPFSELLETEYQKFIQPGRRAGPILATSGRDVYKIDFVRMQQTNMISLRTRSIARVDPNESEPSPKSVPRDSSADLPIPIVPGLTKWRWNATDGGGKVESLPSHISEALEELRDSGQTMTQLVDEGGYRCRYDIVDMSEENLDTGVKRQLSRENDQDHPEQPLSSRERLAANIALITEIYARIGLELTRQEDENVHRMVAAKLKEIDESTSPNLPSLLSTVLTEVVEALKRGR